MAGREVGIASVLPLSGHLRSKARIGVKASPWSRRQVAFLLLKISCWILWQWESGRPKSGREDDG
jgi:hypothetical protein